MSGQVDKPEFDFSLPFVPTVSAEDRSQSEELPRNSSSQTEAEPLDLRLEFMVEAVVFAAKEPLKVQEIREIIGDPTVCDEDVQEVLDALMDHYDS